MIKELVLLDTSAWIAADRPKYNQDIKEMVEKLLDEDRIVICGIIMTELLGGTKTLKEYDELKLELNALRYLPTPEQIWLKVSKLAFELRRKGKTIPVTDIVIACIAMENNCSILHFDNHFNLIASNTNLKVEHI